MIWLVGTGIMAVDYAKVLKGLQKEFIVIGRGDANAEAFFKATGIKPVIGGLQHFLDQNPQVPSAAINAVGIEQLSATTITLMNYGVKHILLEKPGVGYASEIDELAAVAANQKADVVLAYNRRFYQSTLAAQKIITEDGGVSSFNFEFTEWSHSIETIRHLKTDTELQNWFLGNSTHVIDLAFFLGGDPVEIQTFYTGHDRLDWHTNATIFAGAGISDQKALFSYQANWKGPGRFSVEVITPKHRLIFRPLEKLQIQDIGSVAINMVEGIDYSIDEQYKPGLYLQTKAFLEHNLSQFCSLKEQEKKMLIYKKMSGY